MKNKTLLWVSLLMASGSVLAEQSLLEGAARQMATDAATSVAPEAVKGAAVANQAAESANALKETAEKAPAALKAQTQENLKEALKQKIDAVTPEQANRGAEALKRGKDAVKKMKIKLKKAPEASHKATEALKSEANEMAAKEVLKLLR